MSHHVSSATELYELVSSGRIDKAEALRLARELKRNGAAPRDAVDRETVRDRVCDVLAEKVRELLKVSAEDLDVDVELSEYGLDSVVISHLVSMVNDALGLELKPTALFEHPNLRALATHVADEHGAGVADRLGLGPKRQPVAAKPEPIATKPEPIATKPARLVPAAVQTEPKPLSGPKPVPGAEPIAIVGMSGRFPQADDVDEFWRNLAEGRDCITEVPADRWDWRELYGDPFDEAGRTTVKWGGFMAGVADFDPEFFGIAPKEALLMDPQHRLLMLHVWKALEDAGHAADALAGSDLAIIVGTATTGYHRLIDAHARGADGVAATATVPSIGPNRMSFFLDVHGPSEPVETACSSSLVALHRAVAALERDECSVAVAGGVNTMLVPDGHISFGRAGMLSEDGRSKTFSDQADGYARGEGVGMLVLKRLSDAERDGDHIHGLIRATAVNHGGRANSLTAPNPKAQAAVIRKAYRRAGIDPRTVGYVEAHGTGTNLGDPIEVNGLKEAFRDVYADFGAEVTGPHCGLGSVKTNIGHLELSAGVAGVIKVLLQMRHRTLAPSLHCDTANPYLELDGSPFFLVRERQSWPAPVDAEGRELPRRAGVSSFGFGGANAHVVLEEYVPPVDIPAERSPVAVVLSANEPETLMARARQLLAWIDEHGLGDDDLTRMAYTLQVGRVAMPERLAFVAESVAEVRAGLREFVAGRRSKDRHVGRVQPNSTWRVLAGDEDIAAAMDNWVAKGKLDRLLELWAAGFDFDWRRLYPGTPPRRMSLPTYPFNLRRFWIADRAEKTVPQPKTHFLDGSEYFLRDHCLRGVPTLPAVAYLELAREALAGGGSTGVRIQDVRWLRPIQVTEPCDVDVRLEPADERGRRAFEVHVNGDDTVYAQGTGQLDTTLGRAAETVAIDQLRAACSQHLDAAECYRTYERIGMDYGPALRTIQSLHYDKGIAVARLSLPREAKSSLVLNPSLLDGALQAVLGLWLGEQDDAQPPLALPFAAREVQVHAATPAEGWAAIRLTEEDRGGEVRRLDVDICDTDGKVCVRFVGFTTRTVPQPEPADNARTCLLTPVWDAVTIEPTPRWPAADARVVLLGGSEDEQAAFRARYAGTTVLTTADAATIDGLAARLPADVDHVVWLAPATIETAFRLVKAVLATGGDARGIGWTVLTRQARRLPGDTHVDPTRAGVHGLFGSLAKEYPHWSVRVVDVDGAVPWDAVLALPADPAGDLVVHRHGEWYRQRLLELAGPGHVLGGTARLQPDDVVVAIGGAGGIGAVWTEHLMRQYRVRVVWIGRRPLDADIEARRQLLAAYGPVPDYVQADATDPAALRRARDEIVRRHGSVRGVLHAAVVLGDQSLARMDERRFRATYAAKADVATGIAEVFADQPLDFVVFFSSLQSFVKAPGQANYAAGCTFGDAYAEHLATRLGCRVKVVNWGYWGGVGVVADDTHRQRMAQAGVASIERAEGMAAYDALMVAPHDQLALVKVTNRRVVDGLAGGDAVEHLPVQAPALVAGLRDSRPDCTAEVAELRTKVVAHEASLRAALLDITWAVLRSLGLFADDRAATADEWRAVAGIDDRYDRWTRHTLNVLAEAGHLRRDGDRYAALDTRPVDLDAAWAEWGRRHDGWLAEGSTRAQARLVDTTLRALGDILTGRRPATDVLFPDSSVDLVEGLYRHNPVADYFNGVLADTLVEFVRRRVAADPGAKLRVLEIGAGTGGTSATVFERLRPWREHVETYCYTDISQAFLRHARREYGEAAPYLDTRLFDVEQPLAGQAVPVGGFDVVIATNVLHATRDIRTTLRNTKAALRANGILLLNELSDGSVFSHLTFGLLDGWWRYDDPATRVPGAPVLTPATWQRVLAEVGFRGAFPAAVGVDDLGQQVLVAESDGVVRQPRPADAPVTTTPRQQARPVPAAEAFADRVVALMADVLEMTPAQLELDVPLRRYGFDSIFMAQFLALVKKELDETVSLDVIAECETLREIIDRIGRSPASASPADFPELVRMNRVTEGRPVFWVHHGHGSVDSYRPLARRSGRPFYGIQPKGWVGPDEILRGQVPMARHYASLIRAVQPEGPYDLGGFSLGGLLAYEVARQLQLRGAEVRSLVMLDTLDGHWTNHLNTVIQGGRSDRESVAKVSAYRAVNLVLGENRLDADDGATPILHRDKVDPSLAPDDFLDSLITAALDLGVSKSEAQLRTQVADLAQYLEALHLEKYVVDPLPRPDAVRCYYVRNRSGRFFGDFEPYMVLFPNPQLPGLDDVEYWREWQERIGDFRVIDVDTTSHSEVMTAPESLAKVLDLCDTLYAPETGDGR